MRGRKPSTGRYILDQCCLNYLPDFGYSIWPAGRDAARVGSGSGTGRGDKKGVADGREELPCARGIFDAKES
jgi:hypothetical protein